MTFRRDLETWTANQVAVRALSDQAKAIRRLLRGDDVGVLGPVDSQGLPSELREVYPPTLEDIRQPNVPLQSFFFYPLNDSAVYGWGDPYVVSGFEVNPPLGSVLGVAAKSNAGFHQYRRYEVGSTGPTVVHNQELLGGRRWKRRAGKLLSWGAVQGWEFADSSGLTGYPIYYRGLVLGAHDSPILSATAHTIGASDYVYAIVLDDADAIKVCRREVHWNSVPPIMVGVWEESAATALTAADAIYYGNGTADINASCNEAAVTRRISASSYDGAVWEFSLITWDVGLGNVVVDVQHNSDELPNKELVKNSTSNPVVIEAPCTSLPNWNEWCRHCFQGLFDTPLSSETYDYDENTYATGEAVIKVYYDEDDDSLNEMTFFTEMRTLVDNYISTQFLWDSNNNGSGYHNVTDTNTERYTDVSLLLNKSEIVKHRIYNYYDHIDQLKEADECCGEGNPAVYEEHTDRGTLYKEFRVAMELNQNPINSAVWQQADVSHDLRISNAFGPGFLGEDSNFRCYVTTENVTETVDISQEQRIRTAVKSGTDVVYDSSVNVPLGTVPQGGWDDYHSVYDGGTYSYDRTLRKILHRSVDNAMFGAQGDVKYWPCVLMPDDTVVGCFQINDDNAATYHPEVFWTGGDLMALAKIPDPRQSIMDGTDSARPFATIGVIDFPKTN